MMFAENFEVISNPMNSLVMQLGRFRITWVIHEFYSRLRKINTKILDYMLRVSSKIIC